MAARRLGVFNPKPGRRRRRTMTPAARRASIANLEKARAARSKKAAPSVKTVAKTTGRKAAVSVGKTRPTLTGRDIFRAKGFRPKDAPAKVPKGLTGTPSTATRAGTYEKKLLAKAGRVLKARAGRSSGTSVIATRGGNIRVSNNATFKQIAKKAVAKEAKKTPTFLTKPTPALKKQFPKVTEKNYSRAVKAYIKAGVRPPHDPVSAAVPRSAFKLPDTYLAKRSNAVSGTKIRGSVAKKRSSVAKKPTRRRRRSRK